MNSMTVRQQDPKPCAHYIGETFERGTYNKKTYVVESVLQDFGDDYPNMREKCQQNGLIPAWFGARLQLASGRRSKQTLTVLRTVRGQYRNAL